LFGLVCKHTDIKEKALDPCECGFEFGVQDIGRVTKPSDASPLFRFTIPMMQASTKVVVVLINGRPATFGGGAEGTWFVSHVPSISRCCIAFQACLFRLSSLICTKLKPELDRKRCSIACDDAAMEGRRHRAPRGARGRCHPAAPAPALVVGVSGC
jgi:hypothetical protein